MKKWFPNIDVSKKPICYKAYNNPPRETICSYCPTCKTFQDGQVHESVTETPVGSEIRNYRIISSPIKDRQGTVIEAIEMVDDITEQKKAKEALQESEAKYRTIFETTAAATMIVDEDNKISLVNNEFEKLSGYTKEEMERKRSWTEFIAHDDLARMTKYHRLRRIDPKAAPRNYEFRFICRDGNIRDAFLTIAMIPETTKSVVSILDVTDRKRSEKALKKREKELEIKSRNLEELNTALNVLLKQREMDKDELEERTLSNVKHLIIPYIEKLKKSSLDAKDDAYIDIIESNLKDIVSPFSQKLSSKYITFTPRELQVANLIKEGRTTKEIAELLNTSPGTIDFHRNNIRNKLNLKNRRANLKSYLLTLA
jgi:PAS domain S-box-containing protein